MLLHAFIALEGLQADLYLVAWSRSPLKGRDRSTKEPPVIFGREIGRATSIVAQAVRPIREERDRDSTGDRDLVALDAGG